MGLGLAAQGADEAKPAPAPAAAVEPSAGERSLATMMALGASIRELDEDLKAERDRLATDLAPDEKEKAEAKLKELAAKRDGFLTSLEFVAAGIDPQAFDSPSVETLDLQMETRELLLPIIQELKQLTASPREVESLRQQVAMLRQRGALAAKAVERIRSEVKPGNDDVLKPLLDELLAAWQKRLSQAETELVVAEYKLEELEVKRGGVVGALREVVGGFFKVRGRNLMLALFSALLIFGVMRLAWIRIQKLPALMRKNRTFTLRIGIVIYHAASLMLPALAVLMIFYLAGDWVLLGVALLFLIGLVWAGTRTMPAVYEQMKLLLNLGSVREGERVIYKGLPWEVRTVGVFTGLRNPALGGGHLRLPLRDLMPLVSRVDDGEMWFPCAVDDWVCLSDGTHGKVVVQTPDWVQLVMLGGSRRTYATGAFLQLSPENLAGGFRLRSVFGLDYRHQAIATTEIPAILKERLERELRGIVGADKLKNVSVEFSEATSSALNYTILADFTGAVAQRHAFLIRTIQRICLEACNVHGWVIPFNQVTLHQAGAVQAKPE